MKLIININMYQPCVLRTGHSNTIGKTEEITHINAVTDTCT